MKAVTAPVTFRRFEPVVAPMTVMRKLRTEAESVERLVIRSNYDIPDTSPSIAPCERHVAPPVVAQLLAEMHGMWDLANGGPDPAAYAAIKARDGKTLTSATTDPNNYDQPYFDVNHITVPYNPDPLAVGAAFNGLPGTTAVAPITKVPFFPTGVTFPQSQAFRLAAHAGATRAPNFHTPASGPVLDVYLPKATIATVRLSSYLRPADLDLLGVWGWTSPADQAALGGDATDGQVWPLTPYREIILVHAVRQPLLAPDFGPTPPLTSSRSIGDTTAAITGTTDFDRASTDRIDVRATWSEFVDAGGNPNPDVPLSAAAHIGMIPIANDGTAGNAPVALTHSFGDTKHREIFYEALGTSRFTEYFVERTTVILTGTAAVTLDSAGLVDGSVVVTQPASGGGTTTFELDVDYVVDLVAGTLARTASSTIVSGSSVQVAYLVPPVTRSSFEGTPSGTHVTVNSSARPAAPVVRYTIPAFAFTEGTQADGTFKSVRGGNILRIYLGRPWWSSGEGELLGVALANFVAPVAEFSTQWGRDPLFVGSAIPHTFPQIPDFPLATASGISLSIAEQAGPGVNVVGHTVEYDATRDLWYSDIEISPGQRVPSVHPTRAGSLPARVVERRRVVETRDHRLLASHAGPHDDRHDERDRHQPAQLDPRVGVGLRTDQRSVRPRHEHGGAGRTTDLRRRPRVGRDRTRHRAQPLDRVGRDGVVGEREPQRRTARNVPRRGRGTRAVLRRHAGRRARHAHGVHRHRAPVSASPARPREGRAGSRAADQRKVRAVTAMPGMVDPAAACTARPVAGAGSPRPVAAGRPNAAAPADAPLGPGIPPIGPPK